MALTLTPGRDFGPNEVPTRATLQQAANGLAVTGIPITSIDAGIITIHINDTTAASNLPGEGFLWVDARGDLWGRTADGNVRVRRHDGGWETNRFKCANLSGAVERPGVGFIMATITANSTNLTNARINKGQGNGYDGGMLFPFVNIETAASSATHFRFVGRGPSRFYSPGFSLSQPRLGGHTQSAVTYWVAQDFDSNHALGVQWESDERVPDLPIASASECYGYFMGLVIRKFFA